MANTRTNIKKINPIINQKHSWLIATEADSEIFRNSYLGGRFYPTSEPYLFQHPYEGPKKYAFRQKVAYYVNYISGLVNLFLSAIFKDKTLTRADLDPVFAEDVDRQGTHINAFMREVATWAMVEDIDYVFIDSPKLNKDQEVVTLAQQMEIKLTPYYTLLRKANIMDWVLDSYGNLMSVKIRQEIDNYTDLTQERDKPVYHYKIWTRESWREYDENGILLEEDSHPLKDIPLVPMYAQKEGPMRGLSWIRDIVPIARSIYNLRSHAYEFLSANAIAMLALQADKDADIDGITRGNFEILRYPSSVGPNQTPTNPPMMIVADQAPYASLRTECEQLKLDIYLIMKARLLNPQATAVAASGESKAQDYIATNQTIAELADAIQECENKCHYFRQLWLDEGNAELAEKNRVKSYYPDNFTIQPLDEEIKQLLDLRDVQELPPAFWAEKVKELIEKLLPQLDEEKKQNIFDQIDVLALAKEARKIVNKASESDEETEAEDIE